MTMAMTVAVTVLVLAVGLERLVGLVALVVGRVLLVMERTTLISYLRAASLSSARLALQLRIVVLFNAATTNVGS